MSYISDELNNNLVDVNGAKVKEINDLYDQASKKIIELDNLIDKSNEKIARWQNQKLTSNKYQKQELNRLIVAEKEILITNKWLLDSEKEKQKALKESAKSYIEASEIINSCYKKKAENTKNEAKEIQLLYDIWYQNNKDTTSQVEISAQKLNALNKELLVQKQLVEDTKLAYEEMAKCYGENHIESASLYTSLLENISKYNNLVEKAQKETYNQNQAQIDSIFAMNDYLKQYNQTLLDSGFSQEEIYEIARNVSGYKPPQKTDTASVPVTLSVDETSVQATLDKLSLSLYNHSTEETAQSYYKKAGEEWADAIGKGFTEKFKEVSDSILLSVENTAKNATSQFNKYFTTNNFSYTFSAVKESISEQIAATKKAQALDIARGLNNN